MAENAYEIIITKYPGLKADLDANLDVCDYLMSVFAQLPGLLRKEAIDPRDLRVSLTIDEHDRLKVFFRVEKKKRKDFLGLDPHILYKRNAVIVRVLEVNKDILDLVPKVVTSLTSWAHEKGLLYQDVRVSETILPRGHFEVVSLVRERLYVDDVEDTEVRIAVADAAKVETPEGREVRKIEDLVKRVEDKHGVGVGIVLTDNLK
jgi:hypothetical protein